MSIHKFLKINKKIIFKKNLNKYTLIIDRGRVVNTLYQTVYSSVINKKYNNDVKVILSNPPIMKSIFKSFGEMDFYKSSPLGSLKNIFLSIKGSLFILKNIKAITQNNLKGFVKNFKICDIIVGDLIYDTYIRYHHRYINPKIDLKFLKVVLFTYLKVNLINDIIKNNNIKHILIAQTVNATIGAIALRLGVKNNIKTIEPSLDFLNRKYFIKYNKNKINFGAYNFYYRYLTNDKKLLQKTKLNQKQFNNFFYKRCFGKIKLGYSGETDLWNANQNLSLNLSREKLIKNLKISNKNINKIILVAFHAFSDAPHGDGSDIIFTDYYSHAKETLKFLKNQNNKNILYLIKPHPSRFLYNEHNLFENLFDEIVGDNENIKICPVYINTYNLISLCDSVVTLKGTIAIEFVSNGKRAVTCATTPYSKLNVLDEARNKKEYFNKIKNLSLNSKKLSKKKIKIAQKVLFLMEKNIPENFLGKSKIFDEKFVQSNRRAKSFDVYFNKSFINKIKKNGFLNDYYIKNLEKVI